MKKRLGLALAVIGIAGSGLAADKLKAAAAEKALAPGAYTATVKAIVCEGCGRFIEETLKKNPQIDTTSVDPKAKTVSFIVKPGKPVKLSDLQAELKKSADLMGMGANYTLSDLKRKAG